MPRPGPRPYECVRRAWHSDRHQPMRGSIIQRIFRVVTEAHSSVTRKNREWQEKLPRVVLKAEEIMYSKADSEAEYMDPDTLWDRLNEAIDTIIRRDKSTETGELLQPCIEAALVLGCVPVRASRSQRNNNPRSYLNPRFQEPTQAAPVPPPQPPNTSRSPLSISSSAMGNQACVNSLSSSQMAPSASYSATHTGPFAKPNFPRLIPAMAIESNPLSNLGSVYPLYYGSHIPNVDPQFGFRLPQNSNPNGSHIPNVDPQFGLRLPQNSNPSNVIIGTPVGWRGTQPPCFSSTLNLLPGKSVETEANKNKKVKFVECHGKVTEMDCDLSLRLGPSEAGTSLRKGIGHLMSDGGSSSHRETSTYSESSAKNHEYCFFPRHSDNDLSESCSFQPEQEGQILDRNTTLRKRKAPDRLELDDGFGQWRSELRPNQIHGQSRWPDL